ncbi:MAG: helix-turn-helix domain-containing protein [Planctomycetes bacterium]|nr:helix-turn-helix domain-containing protein [Planctomycetota bacterium]
MKKNPTKESKAEAEKNRHPEFSARLLGLMRKAGLNQSQLSSASGVSQSGISKYLKGAALPKSKIADQLSEALGVSPEFLIHGRDGGEPAGIVLRGREPEAIALIREAEASGPFAYDVVIRAIRTTVKNLMPVILDHNGERMEIVKPQYDPVVSDRRDEIPVYAIERTGGRVSGAIPRWYDIACGNGSELERCEDCMYFRELPDWRGRHSMRVRGESMMNTLIPGDFVIVNEILGPDGLLLSAIESQDEGMSLMRFERFVRHDDICVLSINDDAPTLKRVRIRKGSGSANWWLYIDADNRGAWPGFNVTSKDSVRFYATLIGRAKREGEA